MRTMCQRAIFSVTQPTEDIFLVLRVEKVLQGDNTAVDLYTKTDIVQLPIHAQFRKDLIFSHLLYGTRIEGEGVGA